MGGSPALVVVAGCSFPRGCEFESQQRVLDRYFFTFLSYKLYCCSLKKKQRSGMALFTKLNQNVNQPNLCL